MKALRVGLVLGVAWMAPAMLAAQEDFRSADLGRPIRVEDAIPIHFREWEFELGSRVMREEGVNGFEGVFELKAGLFRNTQIGIEVEGARSSGAGTESASGIEAFKAHVLYGLSRETSSRAALALRVEASTPGTGSVGRAKAATGVTAIATRSFGRTRLHGNSGATFAYREDGGTFLRGGIGVDHPVGLFSKALLADIYVERPTDGGQTRIWFDIGTRLQVSNLSVVDIGLATRLDRWSDGQSNLELVIGFSRVFAFQPSVPPYPNPTIP